VTNEDRTRALEDLGYIRSEGHFSALRPFTAATSCAGNSADLPARAAATEMTS
jgi:hypothetical protein